VALVGVQAEESLNAAPQLLPRIEIFNVVMPEGMRLAPIHGHRNIPEYQWHAAEWRFEI